VCGVPSCLGVVNVTSNPDELRIDDALTGVRKADWARLVARAADGVNVILDDPGLAGTVVLTRIDAVDETIVAHTGGDGPTQGVTLHGDDAARARGARLGTVLRPLIDRLLEHEVDGAVERTPAAVEAGRAWRQLAGAPLRRIDVDELSAASGRRWLRRLANGEDVVVHIAGPHPADAFVVLVAHAWVDELAWVRWHDGEAADARGQGLAAMPAWWHEHVSAPFAWRGFVAAQAGRPRDADGIIAELREAVAAVGGVWAEV
jgi:hypothetical protein